MKLASLAALAVSLPLLACQSADRAPAHESAAVPPGSAPVPAQEAASPSAREGFTLVLIKTGPRSGQLSKEENDRAFAGHFANMGRMAAERQLVVAGPFGERRHDPALRGIFVLATADRSEAERWAGTDPTTRAGVFVLEFHDLATSAPLAAALERDLAWRAEQEAAGRTPPPGEGARSYVLLTAEHADLAERELAPLLDPEGGVFMLGRLEGARALALLDAENLDVARERFAPQLENLGAHELDEWFASRQLERLVEPGGR